MILLITVLAGLLVPKEARADPVTAALTAALVSAGVGAETAAIIAAVVVQVTIAAVSIGVMYLLTPRPKLPDPSDGSVPVQEPVPAIIYAVGTCRVAGKTMVKEAYRKALWCVSALKHGPCVEYERFWIHDDEVMLSAWSTDPRRLVPGNTYGDHRYWDMGHDDPEARPRVHIWLHDGSTMPASTLPADNPATWMIETAPTVFSEEFRADGVCAIGWAGLGVGQKNFQAVFVNGVPVMSVAAKWQAVWDPRDEDQDPEDETTWVYSANPVLIRIWYECWCPHGEQRPYTEMVLPRLALWIEQANACDDLIPQKAGGTAPRYECHLWWDAETDRASIRASIMASCDGWDCDFGDGSAIMIVGKYIEPTITLTDDDIVGYSIDDDENDSDYINHLAIQYTSPDQEYGAVSAEPWRDDASIIEYGLKSQSVDLWQVQNLSQGRRLGKRTVDRSTATIRGTLICRLSALRAIGHRWVRVQSERVPRLADVVVEVGGQTTSLMQMTRTLAVRSVNPNAIDAWAPEDEGEPPPIAERVEGEGKPQMTGLNAIPTAIQLAAGVMGIGIDLQWNDFDDSDQYDFEERHRAGTEPWASSSLAAVSIGGGLIRARVQPVAANANIEYQVRVTGGLWSSSAYADTSTDGIAPGAPTDAAVAESLGDAVVTWRNPISTNFASATVWQAASGSDFSTATSMESGIVGTLGEVMSFTVSGLAIGSYDFWVTAENGAGTSSAPAGPVTLTITTDFLVTEGGDLMVDELGNHLVTV